MPDLMNYKAFQRSHWKRIKMTDMLEKTFKELKRRTKVVIISPNEGPFLRLAVSILMDINKEWVTSKRYLSIEMEQVMGTG
jgi:transposase-like protein